MKVQLRGQELRWRIDEAELGSLLAGDDVQDATWFSPDLGLRRRLVLNESAPEFTITPGLWELRLPAAAVREFAAGLPRRDPLAFDLPGAGETVLQLRLEVDVRDSRRIRGRGPGAVPG